MAKKSQRFRRQRRISRLQQKLQETGQIKEMQNVVVLDNAPKEKEIVEEKPPEILVVKEPEQVQIISPKPKQDLMKLKKADLISMAEELNCEVTIKNTKAQIISAIEKQSAS